VAGNKTAITQVFTNLLSNAIKAVKSSKTPTVKIGYHAKKAIHEFYVQDNGSGISPDSIDKIFDPFFSKQDSTGVGLAIVKKVVEKHGGRIDVESAPGRGTVFTFTIPKEENEENG
jgi:signal transduction histidine kinase